MKALKLAILFLVTFCISNFSFAEGPPTNGNVCEYYEDGLLKTLKMYENGNLVEDESYDADGNLIEGVKKTYYPSRAVKEIQKFKNNELVSPVIDYYENGQVRSETYYENDKLHGTAVGYYENGSVKYTSPYFEGNLEGERIEYWENGTVKSKTLYQKNLQQGLTKQFDQYGNLISEETYANGALNGLSKQYKDKILIAKNNYNMGRLKSAINYYENGNAKNERTYKEGDVVVYREYDETGILRLDRESVKGKLSEVANYGEKGNLMTRETYLSETTVIVKTYSPETGNIDNEQKLEKGKLILMKEFYPSGQISAEHNYSGEYGLDVQSNLYYEDGKIKEKSETANNQISITKYDEEGKITSEDSVFLDEDLPDENAPAE